MVPILNDELTSADISSLSHRTVDQHGTESSFIGLKTQVRMVPREAIVGCLPSVGLTLAGSERTLGDRNDAVHLVRVVLTHTVPVERGSVPGHRVGNMNDDSIAPACCDKRSRGLSIDAKRRTFVSIRRNRAFSELEAVFNRITSDWHNIIRVVSSGVAAEFVCSWLTSASNA